MKIYSGLLSDWVPAFWCSAGRKVGLRASQTLWWDRVAPVWWHSQLGQPHVGCSLWLSSSLCQSHVGSQFSHCLLHLLLCGGWCVHMWERGGWVWGVLWGGREGLQRHPKQPPCMWLTTVCVQLPTGVVDVNKVVGCKIVWLHTMVMWNWKKILLL